MRHELLEKYVESLPPRSKRASGAVAERFLRWLGKREPSRETVEQYIDEMGSGDEPYAAGTIHTAYDIIRRLFIVNGLEWPFKRHEAPIVSERDLWVPALGSDVIGSMVNTVLGRTKTKTVPPRPEHAAYLALSTVWGLRRVEMNEVSPESLDYKNNLIFVQTAKRGRQRYHVIPPQILPYLKEWGFARPMCSNSLTVLFAEMKGMVGLDAYDVGWHSIRRSLTRELYHLGHDQATIYSFMRWKRSTWDMSLRYGTTPVIGMNGSTMQLGAGDADVDNKVLARHPFLSMWGV